jgi:uncharacterized protein YecA (UPF0149 family)
VKNKELLNQEKSCCNNSSCCEPAKTYTRINPKVGRNNPCPCGSGNKFKKCCGK